MVIEIQIQHPLLSVRRLTVKTLEGQTLVNPTSFDLPPRKILAIYGPNGSGKTTFLRAISGVSQHPSSGETWIYDVQIQSTLNQKIKSSKITYLSSEFPSPFELRVSDLLSLGFETSIRPRSINFVVKSLNLEVLLDRWIHTLSDGERQWVMFARALIQNPEVLVLDEAFSKLDLDRALTAAKILKEYAEKGMTFLVASHDLNFLSECSDYWLWMTQGIVKRFGLRRDLFTSTDLMEIYPTLDIHVVQSPNSGRERIIY